MLRTTILCAWRAQVASRVSAARPQRNVDSGLSLSSRCHPTGLKYPGGFPSDGASETPQPLPARSTASPDCDLLEPKAGDQRAAATLILERNLSRSKQGLPASDPGRRNPPTAAVGEAFERANLAKSCATHA